MIQALGYAAAGTLFTAGMTAFGAAMVFLLRQRTSPLLHRCLVGFAAGVMLAASVWSLLIPAIERAEQSGAVGWFPAAGGSAAGILFLLAMDRLLPQCNPDSIHFAPDTHSLRRVMLLVLAVTLHNIPEGMAVGASFSTAAYSGDPGQFTAALALALGIGIQNFPEGAAISLPLRQEGMPRRRAFLWGAASGVVEPVFAVLTVLLVGTIQPLLPWLLSFAAGAMLYVVVEELVPQAHSSGGTCGFVLGFLVMMVLDVALG